MNTATSDVRVRVRKVFTYGLMSNVLTLVTSFLLPPYFLAQLGVDRYGAWLYLFSIPMSLTMCDFGVSAAFSTEVYKLHSGGARQQAAEVFKAGVKILGAIIVLIFVGLWLFLDFIAPEKARSAEVSTTILLLGAYVLSGFFSELLGAPYKIEGRFQIIQINALVSRAAELCAIMVLIPQNNFVMMAAAMLSIRLVSVTFVWWQVSRFARYLLVGSWRVKPPVWHLALPSLMYAVNPLIMFVALQLPLIVLGSASTMAVVVAYTTTRTMARLPLQISNQISFSLYTEYTRLFASGDLTLIGKLYQRSTYAILGLLAGAYLVGMAIGPWFYRHWIGHSPVHFYLFFTVLFVDAVVESLMRNRIALSSSLNLHARDTSFHLLCVGLVVLAMFMAGMFTGDAKEMLSASGVVSALAAMTVLLRSSHWRKKMFTRVRRGI